MSLIQINRRPKPRDLRVFATLWLIFLGTFAALALRKGNPTLAAILGSLALIVGALGLIAPPTVRLVYLAAVYVTFPIGFVVSHLILGLVYFLLITPIGLLMRLLGRDPLQRRFEPKRTSYWESKTESRSPASYLKQH